MADDTKAKDLLKRRELGVRKRLGESTMERVGRRRSEAPGSQRRKRLFDRLGVADPYDPDARERPVSIGAVGLKLTDRRRPAPHARVKDPKRNTSASHPAQAARRPSPKPASPAPTRSPKAPEPAKKSSAVGEIPDNLPPAIRRRLEAQKAQQLTAGFDQDPRKRRKAPQPPAPPPEEAQEPGRLPASLRPGGSSKKKRSARLRMSRSRSTGAPVVREIPTPEEAEVQAAAPSEPPPPERTPDRRPPPGGDVGLDDLFGFAQEGRMRLGRRKKADPPEDD